MNSPICNNQSAESTRRLPDVQAQPDHRRIAIDRVGVKDVVFPIEIAMPNGQKQSTVATVGMYVALPADRKGTHMSRFLEVLNEPGRPISTRRLADMAERVRDRLDAETAEIDLAFTYFIRKLAPVSQQPGLINYDVSLRCVAGPEGGVSPDLVLGVSVAATSLCPCSKEISARGAHNQRCLIHADVRFDGMLWIEDLVEHIESAASTEVYAVLKRPDEKFVTEEAFDNPKFVEDIVRDLATALDGDDRVTWYSISSENFESIHTHNAYARLERDKRVHEGGASA
jgi:GTP cyclohydrolase IB